MQVVKSFLLGSAATLIAVAGAQAADLPVKAKAVEYVKVCSLYGAGFYYIPGTDTCIKIGGYLRADFDWNAVPTATAYWTGTDGRFNRADTADTYTRSRFNTSWDVRTQTEYGTLRSFARVGWQATSQGATINATVNGTYTNTVYIDRAMIQFAGFTFGKAQSFSDFSAPHGNGTYIFFSDTGGTGTNVIAYTAQFGNGLSLTVSAEDATYRRTPLTDIDGTVVIFAPGSALPSNYMGGNIPDFVANLRVDQAWGSAQISGALHQVAAAYYGFDSVPGSVPLGTHPSDKWGWNIRGGLSLNVPWGPGDQLILEGSYGEGASHYAGNNANSFGMYGNGGSGAIVGPAVLSPMLGSLGLGYVTDGVFANKTTGILPVLGGGTASGNIELTTSWSAYGSFQHFWTPALRSSVFGGVFAIDYGSAANNLLCTSFASGVSTLLGDPSGCNFDFKVWQVGTRTIWSPVANLDLSIDVFYSKLDQAHNTNMAVVAVGAKERGTYTMEDQDTWSVLFRAQRNFWY